MSEDEESGRVPEPEPVPLSENNRNKTVSHWRYYAAALISVAITTLILINKWYMLPFPAPSPLPDPTGGPLVDLKYTVYEGQRMPNGINRFLGMRYAAPPIGELRWRAPVEPAHREGVKLAIRFRPICLGHDKGYPFGDQDEDCLFVNVWAPSDATPESRLPVWVFISGGGYNSLSNANWNGAGVVEKSGNKIVMVNFNYRVGMWGFLASEKVRMDGDLNAGLLDQRVLFKWVKEHIASFGGDPDHVVIHGASAGAGSVAMHMIAYGGRNDNLFVGVMSESVFFPAQPRVSEVEYQFDRLVEQTGCDYAPREEQVSCLRRLDVIALQAENHAQPFPGRPDPPNPLFYWTPCIDGDFLEDLPYKMFEDGRFIDVPLLSGTTSDEGSVFAPSYASSEEDVAVFFANNYPKLTPRETDLILQQYPKLPALPRHSSWYPTASKAYGEATFICPNVNILNGLSKNITTSAHRLFAYRYNVQDYDNIAWGIGVPHIFDSPAIFGPGNCPTSQSYWTYNAPIVPVFMAYHISFIRSLDPNIHRRRGSPVWEAWGGKGGMRRLVVETGNTRMEDVSGEEAERCEFWLGMGDILEQGVGGL